MLSKPGVDPSPGISSEDVLIPTERHPACRQREARPGFGTERENLTGDAKGKGASGSNRKAESTDAPERGGPPRSSGEGSVMELERRVVRWDGDGQPDTAKNQRDLTTGSMFCPGREEPYETRVSRTVL